MRWLSLSLLPLINNDVNLAIVEHCMKAYMDRVITKSTLMFREDFINVVNEFRDTVLVVLFFLLHDQSTEQLNELNNTVRCLSTLSGHSTVYSVAWNMMEM